MGDLAKIEARGKEKRDRKKSVSDSEKGNELKKEKKKERKNKIQEVKAENLDDKESKNDIDDTNQVKVTECLAEKTMLEATASNEAEVKKMKVFGLSHENIWFEAQRYEDAFMESVKQTSIMKQQNDKIVTEPAVVSCNITEVKSPKTMQKLGLSQENIWFDAQQYETAHMESVRSTIESLKAEIRDTMLDEDHSEIQPALKKTKHEEIKSVQQPKKQEDN